MCFLCTFFSNDADVRILTCRHRYPLQQAAEKVLFSTGERQQKQLPLQLQQLPPQQQIYNNKNTTTKYTTIITNNNSNNNNNN